MKWILAVLVAFGLTAGAAHAVVIGGDDFDGGGVFLSRTIVPDNSGNNGAFASSIFDVFGITDRTVNFDFADDSAGSFPPDTFGVLKTGKTDKVFGVEDLTNPDNPAGTGVATWTFDVTGYTDLEVSIDFASMGDFEQSNDSFTFTAQVDAGLPQTIFSSVIREDINPYTYTLESGTQVNLDDPVEINGTVLDNNFQTLVAAVSGTGSTLTLTFNASSDGGSEVFIFDNVSITGVPEPATLALLGLGLGGLLVRRRRA